MPKISIVTPSYNQGQYLEQTIKSVLDQGYPNLEYIIIDGGSTDNSVEIIKKYEDRLAYRTSESDGGMYEAIQKGFAKSTGEIMGWINSDDILHQKALFTIAELLTLPGVSWIQGIPNVIDEKGRLVQTINLGPWSELRFYTDDYCIQQESTFWTRALWDKAGGYISTEYKVAGDYELWSRFFQHDQLYTPTTLLGGFRLRKEGQLSHNWDVYKKERDAIRSQRMSEEISHKIQKTEKLKRMKRLCSKSRFLNVIFLVSRIERKMQGLHGFPSEIIFDRKMQSFHLKE